MKIIRKIIRKILFNIPILGKLFLEHIESIIIQIEEVERENQFYRDYYAKNPHLLTEEQKKKIADLQEKQKNLDADDEINEIKRLSDKKKHRQKKS